MATEKNAIATDSTTELSRHIGADATSTFENDPAFLGSNPMGTASSGNVAVQRSTEDSDDSDEELDDAVADDEEVDQDEEEDDVEEEADDNLERT